MAYCDWGGVNDLLTKYHADEWVSPYMTTESSSNF